MLLGHSLGIPKAPLRGCSSQALQQVSVCRRRRREEEKGLHPSIWAPEESCYPKTYGLTLLLSPKCLSQLHGGLSLYRGLLQALTGTPPKLASTLEMLQLDVANFATTVWQQVSTIWRGSWQPAGAPRRPSVFSEACVWEDTSHPLPHFLQAETVCLSSTVNEPHRSAYHLAPRHSLT